MKREELLDDAIGFLMHSLDAGGVDDGTLLHTLAHTTDGDGWNEPHSLRTTCECGSWEGVEWVQTDPKQRDRPGDADLLIAWRDHVTGALGFSEGDDPSKERDLS